MEKQTENSQQMILVFKRSYSTKRKMRYEELIGPISWSNHDVAIGYVYFYLDAIDEIHSPEYIRVTIEAGKQEDINDR